MNRRWAHRGYELVVRDRGAGRSDLTLSLNWEVLFWREYDVFQARMLDRDIRAFCLLGKLREIPYVKERPNAKKARRKS